MKIALKSIPFWRWPEHDQAAWNDAFRDDGLLEKGAGAHSSLGSRESVLKGYKRWVGHLMASEADALVLSVEQRVTLPRVATYTKQLQLEVSQCTAFNYIKHLYDAMRVMAPHHDWSWLKKIACSLGRGLRPRSRVVGFVSLPELVELAERLMDSAAGEKAHIDYRDGLIIAFLAQHALRRRNIARITISRNLVRTSDGYLLHFEGNEMKNHRAHTVELPGELARRVGHFLEQHRDRFMDADAHDFLWPSRKSGGMTEDAIYKVVRKRTLAHFGRPLHAHAFRYAAAMLIASEKPSEMNIATGLLGHTSVRTTDESYVKSKHIIASRLQNANLQRLREEALKTEEGTS